jgi:hypothetical protein
MSRRMRGARAAAVVTLMTISAPGCGSDDPFTEPRPAAEAYIQALAENDVDVYCPRIRMSAIAGRGQEPGRLPAEWRKACENGMLFELFGALDRRTAAGKARVSEVRVEGERARILLTPQGNLGLHREKDEWVLTCLAFATGETCPGR